MKAKHSVTVPFFTLGSTIIQNQPTSEVCRVRTVSKGVTTIQDVFSDLWTSYSILKLIQ